MAEANAKDTSLEGSETSLMDLLTGKTADEGTDDEQDEQDEQEESTEESEETSEEDEQEESEDEESDDDEDEEAGAAPKIVPEDTVVFTLSDGDKETPVKAGEAKAGYLRQQDYSKKTAETAEERKSLQAERAELSKALGIVMAAMDGDDADATPAKLAEIAKTDPEQAMRLKFEKEARAEQRAALKLAQKQLDESNQKEFAAEAAKVQLAEWGKLAEAFPDLKDPKTAGPVLQRMTKAALAVGFVEDDMNRITDHRLMKLLDLAEKGLRLTEKKPPKPEPKGKKGPVITPGVRPIHSGRKALAAAGEKFKQDRSLDSAADVLMGALAARKRK